MYKSFTSTLKHNRNIEQVSRSEANLRFSEHIERFDKSEEACLFKVLQVMTVASKQEAMQTQQHIILQTTTHLAALMQTNGCCKH